MAVYPFFHQNITNIRNKMEYIRTHFLDFDIICFTETKLSPELTDDLFRLHRFGKMYRKDILSHCGGLLLYV